MNTEPVYRLLSDVGVLGFADWVVTKAKRAITDYRYDEYAERYDLHDSFLKRRNPGIELYGEGRIETGPGSYIGRYSRIRAGAGTRVSIGSGSALSHNVAIYSRSWVADQDFGARDPEDFEALTDYAGDVAIGDDVWIGYNVFVTPDTEIGQNAVVGANAVVTADIPPNAIAVGTPAKVVRFKSHVPAERQHELATRYEDALSAELKEELT
jgi:acetyltransferase-like isoleucine patch superfamily enzyme